MSLAGIGTASLDGTLRIVVCDMDACDRSANLVSLPRKRLQFPGYLRPIAVVSSAELVRACFGLGY
jgi:hypothetical protein